MNETETINQPVLIVRKIVSLWPIVTGIIALIFGFGAASMQLQGIDATATETKGRVDRLEQTVDGRLDRLEQGMATLLERTAPRDPR